MFRDSCIVLASDVIIKGVGGDPDSSSHRIRTMRALSSASVRARGRPTGLPTLAERSFVTCLSTNDRGAPNSTAKALIVGLISGFLVAGRRVLARVKEASLCKNSCAAARAGAIGNATLESDILEDGTSK